MKAVHIVYDCVIEEKILNMLKKMEIERYAKVDNVKCEWRKDLRHMDNHTWPGTDSMILLFLEDDKAKEFSKGFKYFKENLEEMVPLFATVINVEEII